jgi:hypothetical protein
LQAPWWNQQDVVPLEIVMHDAGIVRRREATRDRRNSGRQNQEAYKKLGADFPWFLLKGLGQTPKPSRRPEESTDPEGSMAGQLSIE